MKLLKILNLNLTITYPDYRKFLLVDEEEELHSDITYADPQQDSPQLSSKDLITWSNLKIVVDKVADVSSKIINGYSRKDETITPQIWGTYISDCVVGPCSFTYTYDDETEQPFEIGPEVDMNDNQITENGINFSGGIITLYYPNFDMSFCTNGIHLTNAPLIDVSTWQVGVRTGFDRFFTNCSNLEELIGLENWDFSKITSANGMFQECVYLTSAGFTSWDTSSLTNASYMFQSCRSFGSLGLTSWDVSNLENISYMFANTKFDTLDLSGWDVGSIKKVNSVFAGSTIDTVDLSDWKNLNSTTFSSSLTGYMQGVSNLICRNWDTSNISSSTYFFVVLSSNTTIDITGWKLGPYYFGDGTTIGAKEIIGFNTIDWSLSKGINLADCNFDIDLTGKDISNFDMIELEGGNISKLILPGNTDNEINITLLGLNKINTIDLSNGKYNIYLNSLGGTDSYVNIDLSDSTITNTKLEFNRCYIELLDLSNAKAPDLTRISLDSTSMNNMDLTNFYAPSLTSFYYNTETEIKDGDTLGSWLYKDGVFTKITEEDSNEL